MSATRMLVLGVIRIAQPVHGYEVRRELLTWQLDELANVKPGSIYGAIRTLEKDACIVAHARESEDSRPERTTYVLTGEGDKEFQRLLRQAWWTVTTAAEPLVPALCLMPFLPRVELISALQARRAQLAGHLASIEFTRRSINDGATGEDGGIPEHVREILDFVSARTGAEMDWAKGLQQRLHDGAYRCSGEGDFPEFGPGPGVVRRGEVC